MRDYHISARTIELLAQYLRELHPPRETPDTAELAQAAVDYLTRRNRWWKWEAESEPRGNGVTITGTTRVGPRRAIRFDLPHTLRYMEPSLAVNMLYSWLDTDVRPELQRLVSEDVGR